MVRVLAGTGLVLATMSLIGLAIGCLVRSTAGALAIVIVAGVLIPATSTLYPEWLAGLVMKFWPTMAGGRLITLRDDPALLGPWPGFAVMCCWTAVLLLAAFAAFRGRDA
jgi:hypothetical protein